ncbi:hypothetical protein D3C86_1367570 [compost metagenome]
MQKSVKTNHIFCHQHIIDLDVRIHTSASSQTEKFQRFVFGLEFFRFQIDIHQSIQLVHHDIDILCPYSGGHHGNSFATQSSGVRVEFSFILFDFNCVEIL